MSLNKSGGFTKGQLPTQISSASSLDSFLLNLPTSSDTGSPHYMNIDAYGNSDAEAEYGANWSSNNPLPAHVANSLPAHVANPLPANVAEGDRSAQGLGSIAGQVAHFDGNLGVPDPTSSDLNFRAVPSRRVSAPAAIASTVAVNSSVPEFLYQLTKMLTDPNKDVIEWVSGKCACCRLSGSALSALSHTVLDVGRIEVHSPQKLESHVLKKYFRHSKFASFQRQLNYFGFRKLAGKVSTVGAPRLLHP
jgi:HSF-type DNA-binding